MTVLQHRTKGLRAGARDVNVDPVITQINTGADTPTRFLNIKSLLGIY